MNINDHESTRKVSDVYGYDGVYTDPYEYTGTGAVYSLNSSDEMGAARSSEAGLQRAKVTRQLLQTPPLLNNTSNRSQPAGKLHSQKSSVGLTPIELERPLNVIHVGKHLVRAGIESWLKAVVHQSNPKRIRFSRCVVAGPMYDPAVGRELKVPVDVGKKSSVIRAARDCDVLLISGPAEIGPWLLECRPKLAVFVAHGDSHWTTRILDQIAPVVDHVVAVTRRVRQEVCDGFPTTVIYNGVDHNHLTRSEPRDATRARLGLRPTDFVLGSVMRLSREKSPELLVEAIARLPERFKLVLVGWGALQHKLLELGNRIAPNRLTIVPGESDMGDYYQAFDAFCLPSFSEGFGLATLEAMFCNVPVITTATGFAPELLNDRISYLHCDQTGESIARCVQLLADHPSWAESLAREASDVADRIGYAKSMCRQYEDLLIRLWREKFGAV